MKDILTGLNQGQKDAVTHDRGPLLVVAGAGTGKTSVITKRIAWLIREKKATPSEILALTFTEKAAAEMEQRVDELVPYGFVDTWISTFHAFGDRILRDHALDLGLTSDFKVLSTAEQIIFLADNLGAFDLRYFSPLGNPNKHLEALLSHFSRLKDELIAPQEYIDYAQVKLAEAQGEDDVREGEKLLEIAVAYSRYQELMSEAGCLDFGDQITRVVHLLREHPDILRKYQNQFRYILVDEYQDTNYAQNELLTLLAKKRGNIMVVGDDDQAIYRFRGAAVSNILDFSGQYPGCRQIVLTENYRSGQAILDSAYKLIKHNDPERLEVKNGITKKLHAAARGGKPGCILHFQCDTVASEADRVASLIKQKNQEGTDFRDIAILIRSNSAAAPFTKALNYHGIPFKFSGTAGLYDRPEIRLLIHFSRVLVNPDDDLAFFHLLTSEIYGLELDEAVKLNAENNRTKKGLAHIASETRCSTENAQATVERLGGDLTRLREESARLTAGQIIYEFIKSTGWLSHLVERAQDDSQAEVAIQNIAKFFEKIEEFESVSEDKSIYNFVRHLIQLRNAGDDPATAEVDPDLEAVNVMTIHKAKGLEFSVVFLVSLVAGSFPTVRKSETLPIPEALIKERLPKGDWHLQEERRLFYVGMTRAKNELFLTNADDYGGKKLRKISQFVLEAIDKPVLDTAKVKLDKLQVVKRFEKQPEFQLPEKFYSGNGILTINPHQIDDYLSCPKKFEFIHVLRVPILTHHSVVYGSAVHKAIEAYFSARLAEKPISLDEIIEVFRHNWRSEGFITRDHEDKRFKQGQKSLTEFFNREEGESKLPVQIESAFDFVVPEVGVKVRGRFDAIYQDSFRSKVSNSKLSDESKKSVIEKTHGSKSITNNSLEIRDFKTSLIESQKQADEKAKKNRQLAIYALAKQYETGLIPLVSLYFVDSGIIGKAEKSEKSLLKTIDEISQVAEGIKSGDFEPRPGYRECSWCAYHEICPFTLSK